MKKQSETRRKIFLRLLTTAITVGFFLPFIHLATASHQHRFDQVSGHFSDIVPVANLSLSRPVPKTACHQSEEHFFGSQGVGIRGVSDNHAVFRYCLSANGILLDQIVSQILRIPVFETPVAEETPQANLRLILSGSVLRFAPKQSPPHC